MKRRTSPLHRKNIILYLVMAFIFLLFRAMSYHNETSTVFWQRMVNDLWRVAFVTVVNFALYEYAFPYIGRKRSSIVRNILVAIPIVFVFLMVYSWGLYAWRLIGVGLNIYTPLTAFKNHDQGTTQQAAFSISTVFLFGVLRHVYFYLRLKQATQKLIIEKQQAELNYLKSQTNPHFLFNTLNNIYSLARIKSDLAPESILRLSKILRFMLYEAGGNFISIEQELKIIEDYIELEKLRYDESLAISFTQDIENMKQAVPPLLLIPLVENAFKHGVSETRGRQFINIHLAINNRQLVFNVKNSTGSTVEEKVVMENIGLSNLRKQLELLYADYDLVVQHGVGVFTAQLKINLASHV